MKETLGTATEGGWRRVVLRGSAEFLVIVVSILVALFVDQLREERRDVATEQYFFGQLASDLEASIEATQRHAQEAEYRGELGRRVLARLEDGTSTEALDELLLAAFRASFVAVNRQVVLGPRRAYDELLDSEGLSLIRDGELRAAIAAFYREYDRIGARAETWPQGYREWIRRTVSPDFRLASSETGADCPDPLGEETQECITRLPVADVQRFQARLQDDREGVWSDLSLLVQFQDLIARDLPEFEVQVRQLRARLAEAGY